ncbi:MAG: hypothetical protein RBS80_12435 [Thermoguttaceae bacterium]|nr:hypothetical protein [Thermoguttaceae bacterium]
MIRPAQTRYGNRPSTTWTEAPDRGHTGNRAVYVWLLFVPIVLLTAGCSDYRPERVPVSGQVLIDGQPLEHGFVRFIAPHDRPSVGKLGPDGRFELTCFSRKDGSVKGTHTVTVTAAESVSPQSQKWHAPKEYSDPATSGLTVTVDGPTKDVLFELTWGGRKPFVETFVGE